MPLNMYNDASRVESKNKVVFNESIGMGGIQSAKLSRLSSKNREMQNS